MRWDLEVGLVGMRKRIPHSRLRPDMHMRIDHGRLRPLFCLDYRPACSAPLAAAEPAAAVRTSRRFIICSRHTRLMRHLFGALVCRVAARRQVKVEPR